MSRASNENGDENNEAARHAKYLEKAKELSDNGKIADAVKLLKKAQEVAFSDKIARRIKRMEVRNKSEVNYFNKFVNVKVTGIC